MGGEVLLLGLAGPEGQFRGDNAGEHEDQLLLPFRPVKVPCGQTVDLRLEGAQASPELVAFGGFLSLAGVHLSHASPLIASPCVSCFSISANTASVSSSESPVSPNSSAMWLGTLDMALDPNATQTRQRLAMSTPSGTRNPIGAQVNKCHRFPAWVTQKLLPRSGRTRPTCVDTTI